MKRIGLTTLISLALLFSFVAVHAPQSASAQRNTKPMDTRPKGELRGRLYGIDGEAAQSVGYRVLIRLFLNNEPIKDNWDALYPYSEGEYFYFKDLKPGVYDLHLVNGNSAQYAFRPVHINGIVVKPGRPTILEDIELKKGDTLVEIGTPTILPDPAILVGEKLAELQKQIDELKKENAELKKQVAELRQKR